jgi:hypothetical protein
LTGCGREFRTEMVSAPQTQIRVDGDAGDWAGIKETVVRGADHLWIGQGMERENWDGNEDLSFGWKTAWHDEKLYFLIRVTDDNVQPCIREYSWLNDCVEIYLDVHNQVGPRIEGAGVSTPIEERAGKKLNGYEMHFLPCGRVYLDDTLTTYRLENAQNEMFVRDWEGQFEVATTEDGYVMEIGMKVPGAMLKAGRVMGVDVGVCDDDGKGREGLMLWHSGQVDFWITMDYFGKIILTK